METPEDVRRMRLVGGNLALDFVNTRSGPPTGAADDDTLTGYSALLDWGVYAEALTQAQAAVLRRRCRDRPGEAEAVFGQALGIRDYLDEVFRALATDRDPDPSALARLRDDEAEALRHARLDRDHTFVWTWHADDTLARPLRPVVHAAAQLLTTGQLNRVKGCGGCRFLFYDESKNRSRRWCSMDDCGTAEKIRRYLTARQGRRVR
ncbi:ABATE domain-containing protein [Micromonospora sp. NPDC047134]|uniref:CGNR zinc finger domain-containing protein n=1 Tax=Micromonospora sp. NPDC047134 TaxID=3154340 RepID=UPI0033C28631